MYLARTGGAVGGVTALAATGTVFPIVGYILASCLLLLVGLVLLRTAYRARRYPRSAASATALTGGAGSHRAGR